MELVLQDIIYHKKFELSIVIFVNSEILLSHTKKIERKNGTIMGKRCCL